MKKLKKAAPKGQPALVNAAASAPALKIAIVGTASSSVGEAPWKDESWQIWSLGRNSESCPRYNQWFELHTKDVLIAANAFDTRMPFLKECGSRLIVGHHWEELPEAQIYPWAAIINLFGTYLTSSLAEMIALAITQNPAEIGVWGVDMVCPDEYCVAPETKVLTEDLRWIPVSDVSIGDAIIGFDEDVIPNSFRRYRRAIVEKAEVLTRPCYRLYMEDGTEIVCSAEHRWLTSSSNEKKWRRTDELVTSHHRSDRPTRIIKLLKPWTEDRSWEAGYIAASVDGEGQLDQTPVGNHAGLRIGYSQKENAMSDAFKEASAALGYRFSTSSQQRDCIKYHLTGGRATTLEFLGRVRPRRLLAKFDAEKLGVMHTMEAVGVLRAEFIGEQTVIGLKTSTGTFIAEGFASHNSHQRSCCEYLLGIAKGKGIKVTVAKESPLLRGTRVYGFEDTGFSREIIERIGEINIQIRDDQAQLTKLQEDFAYKRGVLATLRDLETRWC